MSHPYRVQHTRKVLPGEESPEGNEDRQPVNTPSQAPASVSSSAAPACTADVSSCGTGGSAVPTLTMQFVPADPQGEEHVCGLGCNPWLELSRVRCP